MQASDFGNDFKWGVASSAFQTEGSWCADGKGLSIWDQFTQIKGKIKDHSTAEISCDFYNRYQHDIILMEYLGIPNFRFSISWSRLFPTGTGMRNEAGFDFYNRVIDFCLELNIDPWVTLYHWDLPLALEETGGWTNRDILKYFEEYCYACVKKFGDRVRHWMILNEPLVFTGAGYFLGMHAPGTKGLSNFLPAAHHAVMAQSFGARAAKIANNNILIGTTFSHTLIESYEDSILNHQAVKRVDAISNRFFLEPLLGLGYPLKDLPFLKGIETFIKEDDEKNMVCEMDFIGVQNYTREIVRHSSFVPYLNARILPAKKRRVAYTTMDWEIYPPALYESLKRMNQYGIKNIIVTENGAAFPDELNNGKVHDPDRIQFLQNYIMQVQRAVDEGIPVKGYFIWSLTDNFEWAEGYLKRFGLIHVDYKTQRRYIKSSGHWYREFLTALPRLNQIAV